MFPLLLRISQRPREHSEIFDIWEQTVTHSIHEARVQTLCHLIGQLTRSTQILIVLVVQEHPRINRLNQAVKDLLVCVWGFEHKVRQIRLYI